MDEYKVKTMEKDCTLPFPSKDLGILYSDEIKDLITSLLVKDPENRLGNKSGSDEILAHSLFKKFNLEMIVSHELRPSIKPLN